MAKIQELKKDKIVKVYNHLYAFFYSASSCRTSHRELATPLNILEAEKIKDEIIKSRLAVKVIIEQL